MYIAICANLFACMCVCMCVFECVCAPMHGCAYAYALSCVCVCVCLYACACVCMHVYDPLLFLTYTQITRRYPEFSAALVSINLSQQDEKVHVIYVHSQYGTDCV